jgi:hypothetical protein
MPADPQNEHLIEIAENLRNSEKVRFTSRPTRAVVCLPTLPRLPMTDPILAQLAAIKGAPALVLKAKWRTLFDTEPPPYNRRFLESRLAYRIQELAYGGLKKETVERLRVLGKQYDGKAGERPKGRGQRLPIAGTRLIREWQGIEHAVTVRGDDFEYQGRPYKSLSAIAREITGVRWNGWVFFGLKNHRGAA